MITQLRRNIFTVCEQVASLSGKVFYRAAPQNTAYPYLTFFQVTGDVRRDSASEFEDIYLQFSFYDDLKHLTSLEAIYTSFISKLSTESFSLTNYGVVSILRQFYRDSDLDKVAQIVTQYKILLEKK